MSPKYCMLFSTNNVLNINKLNILKLSLRKYASCGVMYWDRPINDAVKLDIENYWRDKVTALSHNRTYDEANKFYVLPMFPYPSGSLHMGHVRIYTLSDIIARCHRMQNKFVIHPIGWDAFGLPAENAAIERNINPSEWTQQNIAQMRKQLKALSCSFDWEREITTSDQSYYKWTQELFLKLYDRNLVYKQKDYVNWDPIDQTVLAHEQVTEDGKSWRSGANVEKKQLNQWFIKTTAFAESLVESLEDPILKQWDDIIKIQRNWIGPCNGSTFRFKLITDDPELSEHMDLWTSCPEFINDVKFVAVSRNSILNKLSVGEEKLPITRIPNVVFINPFTKSKLPVFLTDDITFPTGRNEYLGIPGFSEKDAEFCKNEGIEFQTFEQISKEERSKRRDEILSEARKRNIGEYKVSSHLKDWLISRQRYWGTPIPIINCKSCGEQPVPRNQLPVIFPSLEQVSKEEKLEQINEWKKVECPKCGGPAIREVDTMDTFVDSSWYYIRYLDPKNKNEMVTKEKADRLLPVDIYIGGKEHALLHLYFARFVNHFLYSEGLTPTREPFKELLMVGFVMGKTYKVKETANYIRNTEVDTIDGKLVEKSSGLPVIDTWEKMSKSKNNGVDPVTLIEKYSVDSIRLLMISDAGPECQRNWKEESFDIITNWENKLWLLMRLFLKLRQKYSDDKLEIIMKDLEKDNEDMKGERNYHVKHVHFCTVGTNQIHVAISKMMSFTKRLRKATNSGIARSREFERALAAQIIMLAPFAPHLASELWAGFCSAPGRIGDDSEIQWDKEVLEQNWPQIDMDYKLPLKVFINRRLIEKILLPREFLFSATLEELIKIVQRNVKVRKYFENWKIVEAKSFSLCNTDMDLKLKTVKILNDDAQKVPLESSV